MFTESECWVLVGLEPTVPLLLLWHSVRAQRFTTTPCGRHPLMLLPLDVFLPCYPQRCATTGRTATVKPTGHLPSVTSLALEEVQTVDPSGKQVSKALHPCQVGTQLLEMADRVGSPALNVVVGVAPPAGGGACVALTQPEASTKCPTLFPCHLAFPTPPCSLLWLKGRV
jgi:hypothetical protein